MDLLRAADAGRIDRVKELVNENPSLIRTCRHQDPTNRSFNVDGSAIHYACRSGHLNVVRFLIEKDASILNDFDCELWTPLIYACYNGHKPIVEYLIEKNADQTIKDSFLSQTAIQFAMYRNFDEIVRFLDPNIEWKRRTTEEIEKKSKTPVFRAKSNLFLGRYRLTDDQKHDIEQFRANPQSKSIELKSIEDVELNLQRVRLELRHDVTEHMTRTLTLASNNENHADEYLRSSSTSTNEHILVFFD